MSDDNYFDSEKAYREAVAQAGARPCKPKPEGSTPSHGLQEKKIEYNFGTPHLTAFNNVEYLTLAIDKCDIE